MILSDVDLRERLPNIVEPYDESRIQPASYDVLLGSSFRVFDNHERSFVDLSNVDPNMGREVNLIEDDEDFPNELVIHPGDFVLASTHEIVDIPLDLVCRIENKSSIGRLGLIIETAGYVDPGFHGSITLEMTNLLRVAIIVRPHLPIAQLAFHKLLTPASAPYSGRYQGDMGVAPSRYGGKE